MFTLRDYQQEAVDANVEYALDKKNDAVLSVLPTGSGKSLIIASIVKALSPYGPIIIFQPTKEILEQNYAKLMSYNMINASIFSASLNKKVLSDITFATIGSVINHPRIATMFKFIIIDECHKVNASNGMYEQFINTARVQVMGFTATPYRLATNSFGAVLRFLTRTRPKIFKHLIHNTQTKTLFDRGYLAKTNYYAINLINKDKLVSNSTGADYTDKSVLEEYKRIGYNEALVKVVKRLLAAGKTKILVFTRFVHESEYLMRQIPGIVEVVSAKTKKKDRERITYEFRSGIIKVVANVGVYTIGFDFPELEVVVLAKATKSLALYYQMAGRVLRPHENKPEAWIVDLGMNYEFFGKIEDLVIEAPQGNLHEVTSKGRVLTNVYY